MRAHGKGQLHLFRQAPGGPFTVDAVSGIIRVFGGAAGKVIAREPEELRQSALLQRQAQACLYV